MTTPIVPTDPASGRGIGPETEPDGAAPDGAESVGADAARRPGSARRWWIIGIVGVVLIGSTVAAFFVKVPYYVVQPGSVRPADQRVEVSGAEVYRDDGEVYFTTVYLNQATPALLVRGWLDDAVEIRTESEMYPDGDRDGARQLNRQRMDLSKLTATVVALEQLGLGAEIGSDGTRVLGIADGSPASDVLAVDDVIVEVDGASVGMPTDIAEGLADRRPGDVVDVVVRRGEQERTVAVELAESPEEVGRPVLGIQAEPAEPVVVSDVEVRVDSGEVSGPSAGLAWTLSIIDRLTPGSLTGGDRIAVTGEMRADGTVGAVGGLPQKTAAVKRAGITTFIYPADTPEADQERMRRIAGDDIELRPVADISEAIAVLAPGGLQLPA